MKLNAKQWKRINDILRRRNIDPSQIKHLNCVRHHNNESAEHWDKKCDVSRALYLLGHPHLIEVWTADHKIRYDVLDLEDDLDFEIETDDKVKKPYADKTIRIDRNKSVSGQDGHTRCE